MLAAFLSFYVFSPKRREDTFLMLNHCQMQKTEHAVFQKLDS